MSLRHMCLLVELFSSLLAFLLAVMAFRKRAIPARMPFIGCIICVSLYCAGYSGVLTSNDLETMILWDRFEYLGVAFLPTFWLLLSFEFCGWEHRYKRRLVTGLFLISSTTLLLHFTTGLHGLMFKTLYLDTSTIFPMLRFTPGPWYWVSAIYINISLLVANILLVKLYYATNKAGRNQIRIMLAGAYLVWVVYAVYLLKWSPPGLDITAIVLSLCGVLFFLGLYYYDMFDLVPVARTVLFEIMHEAVILVDYRDRITDCNKAAQLLAGTGSLQAKRLDDAFADCPALLNSLRNPEDHVCELPGDPPRFLYIRTSPLEQRHSSDRLIVIHDVSELVMVRRKLEQLNRHLEERVEEETARRIENERLLLRQTRYAAMGEMIGAIAHQWRQPLTALSALVQNFEVAHNTGILDAGFIAKNVDAALEQCDYMSETINEFRNLLRPEKNRESFSLARKVEEAVAILRTQLANSGVTAVITGGRDPEITIEGYPGEFKQVIINLVSNARDAIVERRAGEPRQALDGLIEIALDHSDGVAHIHVSDNGCGIPENIRERIFDPYFTTKNAESGTGVGLYACRMIIESSMGGSILLENSLLNDGCRFHIILPTTVEPAKTPSGQ